MKLNSWFTTTTTTRSPRSAPSASTTASTRCQADKASTYDETSGKLVADGSVRLTDPNGNVFKSTHVDVTSNFRDAFVASLEVETPDQTHFFADSAQRTDGNLVTFVNGSYTACDVCEEQPQKPPLWNIKATKIVVNQQAHTVSFTDANLDFFGPPVAWLPYFTIPDPSVKRQTGFLWPTTSFSDALGVSVAVPYFWAVSTSSDLTVTPGIYSKQGLLGDAQWRQRLDNGQYSISAAAIDQRDKSAFSPNSSSFRDFRGGLASAGSFDLNPRWNVSWDGTLLSDRTFTRDYNVLSGENSEITSYAKLTGIGDQNFFQAQASSYQILTEPSAAPASNPGKYDQARQAVALPVIDYRRVNNGPGGGVLTMTSNLTSLDRTQDDPFAFNGGTYYAGTAGTTTRGTQEVDWQRQTDRSWRDSRNAVRLSPRRRLLPSTRTPPTRPSPAPPRRSAPCRPSRRRPGPAARRAEPWRRPTIIQPRAQFILRPNEVGIGTLPNNDAESLVYEVSNLFDWDKFSGFDRNEGGSRVNLGVQYNGSFADGAAVNGTFGQSFQVFGQNSFATADSAGVGPASGLATTASDYVGAVSLDTGVGPSVQVSGRFDDKTFAVNRAEIEATAALGPVTASAAYFYLRQSLDTDATPGPASVVHGAASVNLSENWRAFGSLAYDVVRSALASNSFGVAFDNSCLTFAVTYDQTFQNYTDLQPDRTINFRLELRTLGTGSVSANVNNL